jgi:hypothetical protein
MDSLRELLCLSTNSGSNEVNTPFNASTCFSKGGATIELRSGYSLPDAIKRATHRPTIQLPSSMSVDGL